MTPTPARPAGGFRAWLESMRAVLRGEQFADVPCGDCVGCCVSSYPIPLRPTDDVALRQVPDDCLKMVMRAGDAQALMLYRADGTCPMLRDRICTIYADRPQTCRDYDCRIYAATGLMPDGDRPVIQQRVAEWSFSFTDAAEQAQADALGRAARFIRQHAVLFPEAMRAESATAAAVLAVKAVAVFANQDEGQVTERVRQVIEAARQFDAGCGVARGI